MGQRLRESEEARTELQSLVLTAADPRRAPESLPGEDSGALPGALPCGRGSLVRAGDDARGSGIVRAGEDPSAQQDLSSSSHEQVSQLLTMLKQKNAELAKNKDVNHRMKKKMERLETQLQDMMCETEEAARVTQDGDAALRVKQEELQDKEVIIDSLERHNEQLRLEKERAESVAAELRASVVRGVSSNAGSGGGGEGAGLGLYGTPAMPGQSPAFSSVASQASQRQVSQDDCGSSLAASPAKSPAKAAQGKRRTAGTPGADGGGGGFHTPGSAASNQKPSARVGRIVRKGTSDVNRTLASLGTSGSRGDLGAPSSTGSFLARTPSPRTSIAPRLAQVYEGMLSGSSSGQAAGGGGDRPDVSSSSSSASGAGVLLDCRGLISVVSQGTSPHVSQGASAAAAAASPGSGSDASLPSPSAGVDGDLFQKGVGQAGNQANPTKRRVDEAVLLDLMRTGVVQLEARGALSGAAPGAASGAAELQLAAALILELKTRLDDAYSELASVVAPPRLVESANSGLIAGGASAPSSPAKGVAADSGSVEAGDSVAAGAVDERRRHESEDKALKDKLSGLEAQVESLKADCARLAEEKNGAEEKILAQFNPQMQALLDDLNVERDRYGLLMSQKIAAQEKCDALERSLAGLAGSSGFGGGTRASCMGADGMSFSESASPKGVNSEKSTREVVADPTAASSPQGSPGGQNGAGEGGMAARSRKQSDATPSKAGVTGTVVDFLAKGLGRLGSGVVSPARTSHNGDIDSSSASQPQAASSSQNSASKSHDDSAAVAIRLQAENEDLTEQVQAQQKKMNAYVIEVDQLQSQIDVIQQDNGRIDELMRENADLKEASKKLQADLSGYKHTVEPLQFENDELAARTQKLSAELETLRKETERNRKEREARDAREAEIRDAAGREAADLRKRVKELEESAARKADGSLKRKSQSGTFFLRIIRADK